MEATAILTEEQATAPCECPVYGFCSRYRMRVAPGLHKLCQTSEPHREALATKAGLIAARAPSPPPETAKPTIPPCRFRSKKRIGKEPCLPCDAGRSVMVEVFGCSSPSVPQGRCTIAKGREVKNAKTCIGCLARRSDTPSIHFLPAGYERNNPPKREMDLASRGEERQAFVYDLAAKLGRDRGCDRLVDVGCGNVVRDKLGFETILGIDLEYARPFRTSGEFIACNLDGGFPSIETGPRDVVICADVFEHLIDPRPLLFWLASCEAGAVVVSTPDRERLRKNQFGPPGNSHHVQEWSEKEFDDLLDSVGFRVAEKKHVPSRASFKKEVCYVVVRKRDVPPMDAVWFFRHSTHADEELKYSMRSAWRHAPWLRQLFVLGDRPAWLADSDLAVHVPWEAVAKKYGYRTPVRNQLLMFRVAIDIPGLAEDFLSFSDDFIVLRDLSRAEASRERCKGRFKKPTEPHAYRETAWKTLDLLESMGASRTNFDAHVPMRFTKRRVRDAWEAFRDFNRSEERNVGVNNKLAILGLAMKREGFVPVNDAVTKYRVVETKEPPSAERLRMACAKPGILFLNFDDGSYGSGIREFLQERFPDPASWER